MDLKKWLENRIEIAGTKHITFRAYNAVLKYIELVEREEFEEYWKGTQLGNVHNIQKEDLAAAYFAGKASESNS